MEAVTTSIEPTQEQVERLLSGPDDGPLVMLNLLRFKERADGPGERTGFEAYTEYGENLQPLFDQVGAEIVQALDVSETMIGPAEGVWDLAVLVRYPSRAAFVEMLQHPDYLGIHADRAAALEGAELHICRELA